MKSFEIRSFLIDILNIIHTTQDAMGSFAPSTASTQATTESMARGRQQGYQNYGANEELLLCDLAAKILPTGRNMWMTLAAESNGSRDPAWRERDFDSLRRKFRKLYGKANPTGNQGDRLTLKQRAILMAHETQYEIEKKGGAHTSHDGRDNGEDDENLMDEVNVALFADEVGKPFTVKPNSVSTKGGGDSNRARIDKQQEDDEEEVAEEDDESVSSVNSVNDEKSSEEGTSEEADANQPRDPPPLFLPLPSFTAAIRGLLGS